MRHAPAAFLALALIACNPSALPLEAPPTGSAPDAGRVLEAPPDATPAAPDDLSPAFPPDLTPAPPAPSCGFAGGPCCPAGACGQGLGCLAAACTLPAACRPWAAACGWQGGPCCDPGGRPAAAGSCLEGGRCVAGACRGC